MNHPNLAPFVVDGWLCGRLLGIGSYGSVEEVSQLSYPLAQHIQSWSKSWG